MVGKMKFLIQTWSLVWPNLIASALWVPTTLFHISRSNRKSLHLYFGTKPGPDTKAGIEDD